MGKRAKSLISIILLIVLFSVALILYKSKVLADSNLGTPYKSSDLSAEFNQKNGSVLLNSYKQGDNTFLHRLILKRNNIHKNNLELSGFEEDIYLCRDEKIAFPIKSGYLCLVGPVGVHSENLQIIRFVTDHFEAVQFAKDNEVSPNLVSDVPAYKFESGNVWPMILVYDRNYDQDPLADAIESAYSSQDGVNYTYGESREVVFK